VHPVLPTLAGRAGFSTAPFHMYKMIGVDELQVMDLGVTRMLVHRLVRVYPHACAAVGCETAPGGTKGVCRISNRRFHAMGRRCKASMSSPGYFCSCLLLFSSVSCAPPFEDGCRPPVHLLIVFHFFGRKVCFF